MYRVVFLLLFPSLAFAEVSSQSEFLTHSYEQLDLSELQAELPRLEMQSTTSAYLASALYRKTLHEIALLRGRPHEAAIYFSDLQKLCLVWEENSFSAFDGDLRARAGFLCAWVEAQGMSGAAWWKLSYLERVQRCLHVGRAGNLSNTERNYLEAQISSNLPPSGGQDVKHALVTLAVAPQTPSGRRQIKFAVARLHEINGNRSTAKVRFDEFRRDFPNDSRLQWREEAAGVGRTTEQAALDGYGWGIHPGLFVNPADGLGLAVRAEDNRFNDGDRSGAVTLAGTTKGSLKGKVRYEDGEIFPSVLLELEGSAGREHLDYFPLGIRSLSAGATSNLSLHYFGSVGARVPVYSTLTLAVGWLAENSRIEDAPLAVDTVTSARSVSYSGPWAELGWDDRDSRSDPWQGLELRGRGVFPTSSLGSLLSFERWDALFRYYWMLSKPHHLNFQLSLASASQNAPLIAYPFLAGSARVPGVRSNRFRDRNSYAGTVEYQFHTSIAFRGAAFVNFATVAPALSDLTSETPSLGGGIAFLIQDSALRANPARIELGVFKGEWVFQAVAGFGL